MYNKTLKQPSNFTLKNHYILYRNILNKLIKLANNLFCCNKINEGGMNFKKDVRLKKHITQKLIKKTTIN